MFGGTPPGNGLYDTAVSARQSGSKKVSCMALIFNSMFQQNSQDHSRPSWHEVESL